MLAFVRQQQRENKPFMTFPIIQGRMASEPKSSNLFVDDGQADSPDALKEFP